MLPNLSLVLGGANSGKSTFAEHLLLGCGAHPVYVATAESHDAEMAAKIKAHRATRGTRWRTVEAPLDLASALAGCGAGDVVLIDCATMWLTNEILADAPGDLCDTFMQALADAPCPVVVVSNEVGQGIVPDNALARRFRGAQGRLNQRIAAQAGLVVAVMAGLPLVLKGALPEDVA